VQISGDQVILSESLSELVAATLFLIYLSSSVVPHNFEKYVP
jgi:hypothetical protein